MPSPEPVGQVSTTGPPAGVFKGGRKIEVRHIAIGAPIESATRQNLVTPLRKGIVSSDIEENGSPFVGASHWLRVDLEDQSRVHPVAWVYRVLAIVAEQVKRDSGRHGGF